VVTLPWGIGETAAEKFIKQKFAWVLKSLDYFKSFSGRTIIPSGRRDYLKNKHRALLLVKAKVLQLNQIYNFSYNRVSVKNQKSRWGSCSKRGNLNFNYKIVYLPEALTDYLIVHELCHLKEMNHSKNFWLEVGRAIPDYKVRRRELRNFGVSGI